MFEDLLFIDQIVIFSYEYDKQQLCFVKTAATMTTYVFASTSEDDGMGRALYTEEKRTWSYRQSLMYMFQSESPHPKICVVHLTQYILHCLLNIKAWNYRFALPLKSSSSRQLQIQRLDHDFVTRIVCIR